MSADAMPREVVIDDAAEILEAVGTDTAGLDAAASADVQGAIRILAGNPTDQDIAALVTVLTSAASAPTPVDSRPPELWGAPASMHRTYVPFSPYSFAASQRY
ncbi:acyl-CoA carboxylase subunit epsilon [Rhodococcus sp. BGS-1C]|uniref:acyl-CoA carboxylase subunit epsilon n=1 Tax=unclassified Rhodococcus (in: high G+C Gram-positive bacteria) TaxID=192944 RepID=UPI000959649F|nr:MULTISPECIES: acyl-CoA carboxylase subunit epsilon [unclassified Rhodococcus (in: high G+C Gram-positive bacteria)]MCC8928435.1 acyl-CoA carboxylase subunit epsilon [Rhodococcus sp. I2R]OLT33330.1 hypothetical protein BJF84_23040 [Rhodococcus sp. CUA-806]